MNLTDIKEILLAKLGSVILGGIHRSQFLLKHERSLFFFYIYYPCPLSSPELFLFDRTHLVVGSYQNTGRRFATDKACFRTGLRYSAQIPDVWKGHCYSNEATSCS